MEINYEPSIGYEKRMNSGLAKEKYSHLYIHSKPIAYTGKSLNGLLEKLNQTFKTNFSLPNFKYGQHEIYIWHGQEEQLNHLQVTLNNQFDYEVGKEIVDRLLGICEKDDSISSIRILRDSAIDEQLVEEFLKGLTITPETIIENLHRFNCIESKMYYKNPFIQQVVDQADRMLFIAYLDKTIMLNEIKGKIKEVQHEGYQYGFFKFRERKSFYPYSVVQKSASNCINKIELAANGI